MLEPREVGALLITSKKVYTLLSGNKATWTHIVKHVAIRAKASIGAMQEKIDFLRNDDKRFAFLKGVEGTSPDEEVKRLIDEFICKRKRLGDSLVKIVQDCKSFIYTGETYQEGKKQAAKQEGGGLFSAFTGMLGMGGAAAAKEPEAKEEDPAAILAAIVSSERNTALESVVTILNNTGSKMSKVSQERVNRWVTTMQRCFVVLFKSVLCFYCEAKDVENLKDFLTDRFEKLKDRNKELKDESKKVLDQINELISVPDSGFMCG